MASPQPDLLIVTLESPIQVLGDAQEQTDYRPHSSALFAGMTRAAAARGGALWVCAANDAAERAAARRAGNRTWGQAGIADAARGATLDVMMLDLDEPVRDAASRLVHGTLLPLLHRSIDLVTAPVIDAAWWADWSAVEAMNQTFADTVVERAPSGSTVMLQNLDLLLVPALLRAARSDLRIGFFVNAPFAGAEVFAALPSRVTDAFLDGLLAADQIGFHTEVWRCAFIDCCRMLRGNDPSRATTVAPLAIDVDEILPKRADAAVVAAGERLRKLVDGRRMIGRADRALRSNNLERGLLAYRELLRSRPEWLGRVVHVSTTFPSSRDDSYGARIVAVQRLVEEIDREFGTLGWTPVSARTAIDYPASLAVMEQADVFVDTALADGMSVVVLETAVLTATAAPLVLSTGTGVAQRFPDDVLLVDPVDVSAMAEALHRALSMPAQERHAHAQRLREAVAAATPQDWFTDLVTAVADGAAQAGVPKTSDRADRSA